MLRQRKWITQILIASLILNLLGLLGGAYEIYKHIRSNQTLQQTISLEYTAKESSFQNIHDIKIKNVFLGDSITAYFDIDEEFSSSCNQGISGDTVNGILQRIDDATALNPDRIFIMAGINDINSQRSVKSIISGYQSILNSIKMKCPSVKIYLESVLPINSKLNRANLNLSVSNNEIIELNRGLQSLANSNGVSYLDLYSLMHDSAGELPADMTIDGVHINGNGYRIWADLLKTILT
jgi:hypothetical protein